MNQSIDEKSPLYLALEQYNLELIKQYDVEFNEHVFSKKYNRQMHHLINTYSKWYFSFVNTVSKRVAIVIISIIFAFTSTTFSIKALREPVINFIVETFEKFSLLLFNDDYQDSTGFEAKTLNFVPDGFIIEDETTLPKSYRVSYTDNNNHSFYFRQVPISSDSIILDTENSNKERIKIQNGYGIYNSVDGYNQIIWNDNKYKYVVFGNIEKDILIRIAKNIT